MITQHHRSLGEQKSNDRLCESLSGTFDWVEFLEAFCHFGVPWIQVRARCHSHLSGVGPGGSAKVN